MIILLCGVCFILILIASVRRRGGRVCEPHLTLIIMVRVVQFFCCLFYG